MRLLIVGLLGSVGGCSSPTVTAISAANEVSCAIVRGGAQCWGWNHNGQLGIGSTDNGAMVASPARVLGLSSGVSALAAEGDSACVIVNDVVECWGGLLGNAPTPIAGLPGEPTAIATGSLDECAIVAGQVWCWGVEDPSNLLKPERVEGLPEGVSKIAGDQSGGCAIADGGAWCWGYYTGQSYDAGIDPLRIEVPADASAVGVSLYAGACILASGKVWCWGYNWFAGDPEVDGGFDPIGPTPVASLSEVSTISVGWWHACALVDGAAWCWGDNRWGQLGNSDAGPLSSTPVPVVGLPAGVSAIAAGITNTCAIVNDGVWCWGSNRDGELGNPDAGLGSPTPVPVGPWAE